MAATTPPTLNARKRKVSRSNREWLQLLDVNIARQIKLYIIGFHAQPDELLSSIRSFEPSNLNSIRLPPRLRPPKPLDPPFPGERGYYFWNNKEKDYTFFTSDWDRGSWALYV